MSSRREEERNEKIIRGLLKLPPNRRCINCNSLGPQYVCINFWTFICIACSGIHREFTHRVKSVSMAKFTTKEVEALQRGGNQRAREIFLSEWDFQRSKLPDSSKPDKIREFIKSVYMDKKYAGGRSYDKPPRDVQGHKNIEEDQRRASSYHSYSQSPPYDHQYEDRRYGKQAGILSRKPGSDRGLYEGKLASFICSPGRLGDQIYEDRFANEISGPRMSDYSASSAGDTFKLDGQSPNFESDVGYSSPQPIRDILIEDGHRQISYPETIGRKNVEKAPLPQRTESSGSFGSFDSNSASLITIESDLATPGQSVEASFTSGPQTSTSSKPSSPDSLHFPGSQTSISEKPSSQATLHPSLVQSQVNFSASSIDLFAEINESTMPSFVEKSSPQLSVHGDPGNVNLFGPTFVQKTTSSSVPLDLFANINQPLSSASSENASAAQFSQEKGWATFDVSHAGTASQRKATSYSTVVGTSNHPVPSLDKQRFDPFASPSEEAQWLSAQNSISHDSFVPTVAQWNSTSNDVKMSSGPNSSQGWNALDDSFGNFPHSHSHSHNGSVLVNCDVQASPTVDLFMSLKVQEEANKDGLQMSSSAMGNSISLDNSVTVSSFDPSMPPTGASCQERKSTNPFDLPFESDFSDLETSNGFLDMSSLQANLPPVQFPSPFISSLAQPWYSQNAMPPYISSVAPGSLAYVAGQSASSPLPDMPPPGPVAPLGGNPFA